MQERLKTILLYFVFLVLAAPLIQSSLKLIKSGDLYGYFTLANDVDFTPEKWIHGEYQEQKGKYLNDHMGFREDFVRLNNQIDLSLFDKLNADAVMGKSRYLFQQGYVDEHYGRVFYGYDSLRNMCLGLKYIQDQLAKEGKTFLVICPATKDDYYPEYLPYNPTYHNTQLRNAIVYKRICDSLGINHIDIDAILIGKKGITKESLFTKEGTHWSIYAGAIAVDTIIKKIEQQSGARLPEIKITSVEHTAKARYTDNDIGWPLNLLSTFVKENYSYPVISMDTAGVKSKPSLVLVGDSYNWTLITDSLTHAFNDNWQFWYYFKNVKNGKNMDAPVDALSINGYNWQGGLDSANCLIVNYAPHNLPELNSFVDSAVNYFKAKAATVLK